MSENDDNAVNCVKILSMSLIATVKVGKISNLSDARYCSGMGVSYLGFRISAADPAYLDPVQFQEMRGWFAGPQIVAEVSHAATSSEIKKLYEPDYLEVPLDELEQWAGSGLPLFIRGTANDLLHARRELEALGTQLSHLVLIDHSGSIAQACALFPTLVTIHGTHQIHEILDLHAKGFNLEGSSEDKPGFTDYGQLPEILESLESS